MPGRPKETQGSSLGLPVRAYLMKQKQWLEGVCSVGGVVWPIRSRRAASKSEPTRDDEAVMDGALKMDLWVGHPPATYISSRKPSMICSAKARPISPPLRSVPTFFAILLKCSTLADP